jgi:hypothetical protein
MIRAKLAQTPMEDDYLIRTQCIKERKVCGKSLLFVKVKRTTLCVQALMIVHEKMLPSISYLV